MNIIRRLAVKSYRKELIIFSDALYSFDNREVAKVVACSIWIRSMLQVEGNIHPLAKYDSSPDDSNLNPELYAYPLMLKDIENFIKILKKHKQNSKVAALNLWVHTLRAIIRPEINAEINVLWDLIMKSREHWEEEINFYKKDYLEQGIQKDIVDQTFNLAQEIIKCLPPKQLLLAR